MIFIGIDPGNKGGLAIIDNNNIKVQFFSINEYTSILKNYENREDVVCYIEQVHSMPNQGTSSMFSFGYNFGLIMGILSAYKINIREVTPQKWKKYFNLTKDKEQSIALAKNFYPEVNLKKNSRCKKDSDGIAEALLIARYGLCTYAQTIALEQEKFEKEKLKKEQQKKREKLKKLREKEKLKKKY